MLIVVLEIGARGRGCRLLLGLVVIAVVVRATFFALATEVAAALVVKTSIVIGFIVLFSAILASSSTNTFIVVVDAKLALRCPILFLHLLVLYFVEA